MSECKVFRREIEETADGRSVSAGARLHISSCRVCRDELRERESLRALVGGLGRVGAPADFEFRLRARMAAAKPDGGRGRFSGTRWLYGFAPVAIAVCFVVVSSTLYFRPAPTSIKTDTPAVADRPVQNVEPGNERTHPAEPVIVVKEVVEAKPADVAPPRVKRPTHRANVRAVQTHEVAEERVAVEPNTLISSVSAAQVIHLPLKTSAEPLRVILRDERGEERVVPMRSVSFGSQSFLAREGAARPSTAVEVGGVW